MSGQKRILAALLGALAVLVLVIGGLSAVLLLTGGNKGGGSSSSASPSTIDTKPASGRLRLPGSDPLTLDPALATDAGSAEYIVEIFSGLMTISPDLQIVPDLTESYQVSEDGKSYTFKLRPNAVFQDGRPVEASDVKCSLDRAASKATASSTAPVYMNDIVGALDVMAGRAQSISGVEVVDPRTVKITIDAAKPYFLAKLTYTTAMVVDCKQVAQNPKNWTRQPNGTGPYRLSDWRVGERLVLEANPKYYLGAPKVSQVLYQFSGGSALTRFENNELDVAGISVNDIDRVRDPNSALGKLYQTSTDFSISYIAFNTKSAPFDDPNVRRAFGMAIDRKKITQVTFNNMLLPASGILPPQLPGYTPTDKTLPLDAEGAKKALAASKYKNAAGLPPITMTEIGGGASAGLDTQAYIEQWKQVLGVTVQVKQQDVATFFEDQQAGRLQMFNAGWVMDYPDPEDVLDLKFYSKSSLNDIGYSNPDVDRLLEQARTERDPAKRLKTYQDVEVMLINDAAWLPLYFGQNHQVVNAAVKGWFNPPMVIPRLRFVSVER
jgi:oligopeptide transport system substrate-binding protein